MAADPGRFVLSKSAKEQFEHVANSLWSPGVATDVTLVCQDGAVRWNLLALSMWSNVIKAFVRNNDLCQDCQETGVVVILPEVRTGMLYKLLDFSVSGRIGLMIDEVASVHQLLNMLGFNGDFNLEPIQTETSMNISKPQQGAHGGNKGILQEQEPSLEIGTPQNLNGILLAEKMDSFAVPMETNLAANKNPNVADASMPNDTSPKMAVVKKKVPSTGKRTAPTELSPVWNKCWDYFRSEFPSCQACKAGFPNPSWMIDHATLVHFSSQIMASFGQKDTCPLCKQNVFSTKFLSRKKNIVRHMNRAHFAILNCVRSDKRSLFVEALKSQIRKKEVKALPQGTDAVKKPPLSSSESRPLTVGQKNPVEKPPIVSVNAEPIQINESSINNGIAEGSHMDLQQCLSQNTVSKNNVGNECETTKRKNTFEKPSLNCRSSRPSNSTMPKKIATKATTGDVASFDADNILAWKACLSYFQKEFPSCQTCQRGQYFKLRDLKIHLLSVHYCDYVVAKFGDGNHCSLCKKTISDYQNIASKRKARIINHMLTSHSILKECLSTEAQNILAKLRFAKTPTLNEEQTIKDEKAIEEKEANEEEQTSEEEKQLVSESQIGSQIMSPLQACINYFRKQFTHCVSCKLGHKNMRKLMDHLALMHFGKDITKKYGEFENDCKLCHKTLISTELVSSTKRHIRHIRHLVNAHSVLKDFLSPMAKTFLKRVIASGNESNNLSNKSPKLQIKTPCNNLAPVANGMPKKVVRDVSKEEELNNPKPNLTAHGTKVVPLALERKSVTNRNFPTAINTANPLIREHCQDKNADAPEKDKMSPSEVSAWKACVEYFGHHFPDCTTCTKGQFTPKSLLDHLAWKHFGDKALLKFGSTNSCPICQKVVVETLEMAGTVEGRSKIIRHMSRVHSYLLDCVGEEAKILLSRAIKSRPDTNKTVSLHPSVIPLQTCEAYFQSKYPTCNTCQMGFKMSCHLQEHLAVLHYQNEIMQRFGGQGHECALCKDSFDAGNSHVFPKRRTLLRHLLSKHSALLEVVAPNERELISNSMTIRNKRKDINPRSENVKSKEPISVPLTQMEFMEKGDLTPQPPFSVNSTPDLTTQFGALEALDRKDVKVISNGVQPEDTHMQLLNVCVKYFKEKFDSCKGCRKGHSSASQLQDHLAFAHYQRAISEKFQGFNEISCPVCKREIVTDECAPFEKKRKLLRHAISAHKVILEVVDDEAKLLLKGLLIPTKHNTDAKANENSSKDVKPFCKTDLPEKRPPSPLSEFLRRSHPDCVFCANAYKPCELLLHLASVHYDGFVCDTFGSRMICNICRVDVEITNKRNGQKRAMVRHVLKHHRAQYLESLPEELATLLAPPKQVEQSQNSVH